MKDHFMQTSQRLTMLIVFLAMAFTVKASYTLTDADVEMDTNGYIISCSYSFLDKDIIIPETLDGYTVKGIGVDYNNLFFDKDITSIQFPSGIEFIGRYAFRSNNLTSIDIPIGITSLEERVFSANQLTSITIPDNIISIGQEAFSYNPLTSVTIPSGVDYIGKSAFRSNKLTSITISSGVISIGESAFFNNELNSVDIPNSVSSIGIDAFGSNELTGLTAFVLPTVAVTGFVDWLDGFGNHFAGGETITDLSTNYRANFPYTLTDADVVMDVSGYIISCSYSFEASMITIPETLDGYTVKGIGDDYRNLFKEKAITSIQLPSGLEYIGTSAFSNNLLTSFTIPNSVTLIGEEAFGYNLLANITIPNSVTSLGTSAFVSNQLANLTISNSIDTIRDNVFAFNQLTSITIPNNVTSIEGGAFRNNQLASVTIPNSVTYIGDGAFRFNQLTSFILPTPTITGFIDWIDSNGNHYEAGATVTDLGISYRAVIPYILKDEDVEMDANGYIISCSYSFDEKDIMIPETLDGFTVKGIGDDTNNTYIFYNKGITSIQLPLGLEYIGFGTFQTNSLRSVVIPSILTYIGDAAFSGNQLTSITIPNSVTFIGVNAFAMNQLSSVTIPNSVTFMGGYAFQNNQLTSITIPNSITSIEGGVFYRNQLTSVTIPNSVTSIGVQAFGYNDLTSIELPNSVTYIKANAFYGNQFTSFLLPTPTLTGFTDWVDGLGNDYAGGASVALELVTHYRARIPYTLNDEDVEMNADGYIASCSYNFEASMITIPEMLDGYTVKGIVNSSYKSGVFYYKAILSIQLPSGIEYIGGDAFNNNLLTSIDIPNSVTFIGSFAFSTNQLTSLVIPESVTNLGGYAFASNQLESVTIPTSITTIPAGLLNNNKLPSITIPNSVLYIGEHAFTSNLFTGFVLPTPTQSGFAYWLESKSSVEYKGGDTTTNFIGNYQAKFGYILTDEDVEVDADGYIISCSYNGAEKNIIIPDSLDGYKVKGIADGTLDTGVFSNIAITSLKLPLGIEIIGAYAFASNQLSSVTIPNTVISIGEYAFALNYITGFVLPTPPLPGFIDWVDGNGLHYDGGAVVSDLSTSYYASFAYILKDEDVEMNADGYIISCSYSFDNKDIMIPDTLDGYKVKGIADGTVDSGVFYNKAMASVVLPLGIEYIGSWAFSTNQLGSLTIPNSTHYIGNGAFSSNQLVSVEIPDSVSFIGAEAFRSNILTGFVLPTLTVSGFVNWIDASGNHYEGGTTVTDLSANYRARFPYTLTDVDVEMDANAYIISCSYSFEASMITIPETLDGYTVKGIGDDYINLFYEKAISSIQLPSGLEYIGAYAFSYNLLASVTIPSSVTVIGEEAFSNNLLMGFVLPEAQKEGYIFDNWNGSIPANTEVTDLSIAYTANFTLNTTGIENAVGLNVMVYPNPTKAFITIEAVDIYSVELMSVQGVLVQKLHVAGTHCTIDLSSQDSGIYFLRILGKYGTYVKRFVKE